MMSRLMRFYEKSGCLTRLSNGAYTRLNESANLSGALYALQNDCKISVHTGADSILRDFYGKLHFVRSEVKSRLFAPLGTKLPAWFKKSYENQFELYCSDFFAANAWFGGLSKCHFFCQNSNGGTGFA